MIPPLITQIALHDRVFWPLRDWWAARWLHRWRPAAPDHESERLQARRRGEAEIRLQTALSEVNALLPDALRRRDEEA